MPSTMRASMALIAVIALIAVQSAAAEVQSGTISADFKFIAKFCYHQNGAAAAGTMDVTVDLPMWNDQGEDQSDVSLVIYDDQPGRWETYLANKNNWDCATKMLYANAVFNASGVTVNPDDSYTLHFTPEPFQEATRPRFWFFSLAKCNAGGFTSASFHSHALQSGESSWNKEFSEDQNGLNSLYLIFFFLFTAIVVINLVGTYKLQQQLSYLHPMIKLFLIVLLVEYISVFLLLLHYGSFATNGEGIIILLKLGSILQIVSRCFFMLLLLLLAKGWTISNETLSHKGAVIGLVFLYLLLDIFVLVWSFSMVNPEDTVPPKSVLVLTILIDAVWLIFAAWFSVEIFYYSYRLESHVSKKSMYLKLGVAFLPWLILPVLVSFAVFALAPWVRIRIVSFFSIGLTWLAYSFLVFLFWPSRAEDAFAIATPDVGSMINSHQNAGRSGSRRGGNQGGIL